MHFMLYWFRKCYMSIVNRALFHQKLRDFDYLHRNHLKRVFRFVFTPWRG